MSNSKCPKLARRFFDQVPKTTTEMMKRVDEFIKFEEVYRSIELSRGEFPEKGQGTPSQGNRQRGNTKGIQHGNNNGKDKVINMVWNQDDVSDEPLIVETEVEGFLVRRVFVDQGVAVQVMFEHCFDNMPSSINARLTQTQTELVGFLGEQLIPMGKTKLEVAFRNKGLCRRTMMKFTVEKKAEEKKLKRQEDLMKEQVLVVGSKSIAAIWLEKVVTPLIDHAFKGFATASTVLKPERLKVEKAR
nr:reverse transcriptase domain-containing protein [Tanacetum cinerariifolium]